MYAIASTDLGCKHLYVQHHAVPYTVILKILYYALYKIDLKC